MGKNRKPCPFCGSRDILSFEYPFRRKPGIKGCYIICHGCGACSGNYETVEDAENAWNSRKEAEEIEQD